MRTLGGLYELTERVFGMMGHERMKQLLDAVALFNTVFEKEMDNELQLQIFVQAVNACILRQGVLY